MKLEGKTFVDENGKSWVVKEHYLEADELILTHADESKSTTTLDLSENYTPAFYECVCGTKIPATGTDFEPGCRHCDAIKLDRELGEI